MKKVLVILLLVIMLFSICACTYVPSTRFLSRSQVNSLVKQYGTPQAELTINYTISNTKYQIVIKYDLLLGQAPLAVIRFIQLANDGAYDSSVIDTYNSTYNYMIMGRYLYKNSIVSEKENDKKWFVNNALDTTFKGEFASNNYREPKGGYAEFDIFSLAMYHDQYQDENTTNFDTANGAFILATAKESLNPNNYAVFAKMVSMTYQVGDGKPDPSTRVNDAALTNLRSFTSKTSTRTVYTDETEEETIPSFQMMNTIVTIQVKILGDKDWSKLPQIGR